MRSRLLMGLLVGLWLVVAVATAGFGLEYYRLPLVERIDFPLHDLLKPTGSIGHAYGFVGTGMMALGVAGYSMRRRMRILSGVGRLSTWLRVHIFLCTLGPYLILLHTTMKLGGIVSIAFWSMVIVVVSGVFGRYVYARIPHGVEGNVRDLEELAAESRELEAQLRADSAIPARLEHLFDVPRTPEPRGALHALSLSVAGGVADAIALRRVRAALGAETIPGRRQREIIDLIRRRRRLLRAGALSRSFRRMFGLWHLLHLPLAILLLVVTVLHVGVAYLFGYV